MNEIRAWLARGGAIVVGLSCASCRVEPQPDPPDSAITESSEPESPEPTPIALRPLACPVGFSPDGDSILVAGQPSPIEFRLDIDTRLVAYPGGEGEVLVAVGYDHPWAWDRTKTGATLWRVRCVEPSKAEPAVHLEGAEFSWSVLSFDGQHIYFSYRGVHGYAIATGEIDPLIAPRRLQDCWASQDGVDSEEFVQGWVRPGELMVLSGGPCGFEAEWRGEAHVVTDFHDARGPAKRRPRAWIGGVAAGAGARVWVGDGGECSLEFAPQQVGTPGVWRSEDAGATWTFLPLQGVEAGVERIWPSSSDPARVWAATECCGDGGADECEPGGAGSLFLTTDGGRTWRKILDESANLGIEGLLVDEAKHEVIALGRGSAFVTHDDGRKWKPSSATLEAAENVLPRVEIGGFVLAPTEDGLERRAPDAAAGTGEIVLRPGQE